LLDAFADFWTRYVVAYPWDTLWGFLLPVFLISLLLGEAILYFAGRNRTTAELILCALVIAVCAAVWYSTQPMTNPRILRPGAYLLFVVWVMAAPVALLTLVSHALARSRLRAVKHGGVVVSAAALALAWPFFALSSLCASGLDCI
jgi:hypothetical protein